MKISIEITSQKNKVMKKVLDKKVLKDELQKLADRYIDDMILSHYRGNKKLTDALSELDT